VSSPGPSSGRPADPPGSPSDAGTAVTEDRLLGGRVCLRQPAEGARAAIDPVFLAAATPAAPHQQILDAGCGVGAAMLCLAARVPQCRVVGIELQRDLVRLAGDNLLLNGGADRLSVMVGDLLQPPPRLSPGSFDHVMANPPFIERGRGSPVADPAKAAATVEGDAALVNVAVEVDGELRDASERPVDQDEAGVAVAQDDAPRQAEIPVEPGVQQRTPVDLDGQLAPTERTGVRMGLDPQVG